MNEPKDEDVEKRAIDLARKDKLDWVKQPRKVGEADTPAGASNDERNEYRKEAEDQLKEEQKPR